VKTGRRVLWWVLTVVLAVGLLGAAGFGAWQVVHAVQGAPADSAQARQGVADVAKTGAVKLLSYKPDTVEDQLHDATKLLTGDFLKSYTDLTNNVVIPGAKSQKITANATVSAAAVESLATDTASLILFVNQTVTIGTGQPSPTASTVRVGLQKVNGNWLIARFDPL
jgi:Mce-associated membrane protein